MADEANLIIPLHRSLCFGMVFFVFWPHVYLICKLRHFQKGQDSTNTYTERERKTERERDRDRGRDRDRYIGRHRERERNIERDCAILTRQLKRFNCHFATWPDGFSVVQSFRNGNRPNAHKRGLNLTKGNA